MPIFRVPSLLPAFSSSQVTPTCPPATPHPCHCSLEYNGPWQTGGPQEVLAESVKPTFLPTEPSLPCLPRLPQPFPAATGLTSGQSPCFHLTQHHGHQLRLQRGLALTRGCRLWGPTFLGCRRGAVLPSPHPAHVREQELAGQALAGLCGREGHCDTQPRGRRHPTALPARSRPRRPGTSAWGPGRGRRLLGISASAAPLSPETPTAETDPYGRTRRLGQAHTASAPGLAAAPAKTQVGPERLRPRGSEETPFRVHLEAAVAAAPGGGQAARLRLSLTHPGWIPVAGAWRPDADG